MPLGTTSTPRQSDILLSELWGIFGLATAPKSLAAMLLPAAENWAGARHTSSPCDFKRATSSLVQFGLTTAPLEFIARKMPESPDPPKVAFTTGTPSPPRESRNFGDEEMSAVTNLSDALENRPMCGLP